MVILEYLLVLALAGMTGLLLFKGAETKQKQQKLDNAFYQLLEEKNSTISLIQLAATARIAPQLAKEYLDEQIKTFGAVPEVDADGDTYYKFPKL